MGAWRCRPPLPAPHIQDPLVAAQALVSELGGLDAVVADKGKLLQVTTQLGVSFEVGIEAVGLAE